jgi:hypothetical protein
MAKYHRIASLKPTANDNDNRITSLTAPKFEGGRIKKVWAALCGKL